MRCVAGDIAIVIHDPNFRGRDVGAMVNVLRRDASSLDHWICARIDGRRLTGFWSILSFDVPWMSKEVSIPDAWLKPIRPPKRTSGTIRLAGLHEPKTDVFTLVSDIESVREIIEREAGA